MQELKVVGIEEGALVAVSDDGDRYLIPIDAVMQTKIRQLHSTRSTTTRVSPKEIQTLVRSGLSRDEVAAATGASIEDVERYEGPVLAEREHILSTALSVPVHLADDDPHQERTFVGIIRERLYALDARNERWAAWKEPDRGWMIKLEFTADEIDHDARWSFDPRSLVLHPLNGEATTLSKNGDIKGGLIPKLRAVDQEVTPDTSRFDSGAFAFPSDEPQDVSLLETQPHMEGFDVVVRPEPSSAEATAAATNRLEEPAHSPNDTADLLEALRKRRGEREPAPGTFDMFADENQDYDFVDSLDHVDVGDEARSRWGGDPVPARSESYDEPAPVAEFEASKKKGRTSLPSWDDIVFGTRSEDDPA